MSPEFDQQLYDAVQYDNIQQAEEAIQNGANVNRSAFCEALLVKAAMLGSSDIVDLLLKHGANPDQQNELGDTAFYYAGMYGYRRIMESLVRYKADINKADQNGVTPLLNACAYADVHAVQYLIQHGADVKLTNSNGYTPLMEAASENDYAIVELLLNYNVNINACSNDTDWTALMWAAHNGNLKIFKLLLSHGADMEVQAYGDTVYSLATGDVQIWLNQQQLDQMVTTEDGDVTHL